MDIFEIIGYKSGKDNAGVNYLNPYDSFQELEDGFIYRQVLQSRPGFGLFCPRLSGHTRIMGIFDFIQPDGTRQCLAADKNFLYKYNEITNVFDQIPFAGSMAGYAGFNILDNENYVSGCAYPTATNTTRFIICGNGISGNAAGSSIFFYNGTDIRDFTSVVDNANYAPPVGGTLTKSTYAVYFNERLNFVVPTITTKLNQGVLYSGIRNSSGNGDKFNVAGSGVIQFNTQQGIKGVQFLGQLMAIQLEASSTALQITTDAFNPYRILNIPSVIGTSASFSSVSWANEVTSLGKEGIIQTDGRENLRIDNKIPFFTVDEIDQLNFELIYGGFDRLNGQFLWSYKEQGLTDDLTQDRVLVRDYEEDTWAIFNQRLTVFGYTVIGQNLVWDQIDENAGPPGWARWDTTEESWDKIGQGKGVGKTLAGDDLGFIYELNRDFDDYITAITNITNASNAVLTVSPSAFKIGDKVTVDSVLGMTEINNFDPSDIDETDFSPYTVVSSTATSITLDVDSTLFSAYTPNTGKISKIINFRAKTIPFNPYRNIGRKFYISHVEFLIDCIGGSLKVDVFEDEEDEPFKKDILVKPTSTTKGRQWVTMTVNHEANFITFLLKQSSPSVQFKGTSIRIHGTPGALTSG